MDLITLELRPRLQSCNVFIAMRPEFRFNKKLEIKLSESNIILILEEGNRVNLSLPFVKVIPTSVSALSVTNNWICFRLQTTPLESVFGSFGTEIVTDSSETIDSSTTDRSSFIVDDIKAISFQSSECNVLCTCCKNVISKSINFKRFLPLPDTEYDPNEWFCCTHAAAEFLPSDVQSRETDYLYGSYFSVLRKAIFADNIKVNGSTLTCDKCSLHIGMLYNAYDSFKVWNCCVDYKSAYRNGGASSTVNATDAFDDFVMLVKASLNETFGEIVLRSSNGNQVHCLWIRPMDRKLNLMTEPSRDVTGNDTDTIVDLRQRYVAKVLYKYGTSDITKTIIDSIDNVTCHQVSLSVIEAGLKCLSSSTKRLPYVYRIAANRFFLGYIVLQRDTKCQI